MIRVNNPQTTLKYPLNYNQPLVIGITIPGMLMRKVKKIMTAFPMAAFRGHVDNNKSRATFPSVGTSLASTLVVKAKMSSSPPVIANNKSAPTYVKRILSFAISNVEYLYPSQR